MEQTNRGHRYIGRAALRKITTVDRCYDCGRATLGSAVAVRRTPEGVGGFAGLATCGRVWLCPVCNSKVMASRAIEIGAALTWASVEGYSVLWGSLTVRHNAFSDLAKLLEIQRAAWRHVVQSRHWSSASAVRNVPHSCTESCAGSCERKTDTVIVRDGRVGYIRAAEVTIGENGWHPHFHPIIVWRGDAREAQAFADLVVDLWVEGVEKAGGEAIRQGGQQLKLLTGVGIYDELTGYITKATYDPTRLAIETVWSQGKHGRGRVAKTASHWSLLASIEAGLADESERWWQLEEAVTGHRMITWSRGLRRLAGLADERDDEEIASDEVGTAEDTVCFITTDGWIAIRDQPEILALILDVVEASGWVGLRPLLDGFGVDYFVLEMTTA